MSKLLGIFIFLFLMVSLFYSQDKPLIIDSKEEKANQVLQDFRKKVSKKTNILDVKSLTVVTDETFQLITDVATSDGKRKVETNFIFPDKIQRLTDGNYSTNKEISSIVLNGELISYTSSLYKTSGEKINFDPFATMDQNALKTTLKRDCFYTIFPISLDSSWHLNLKFEYVGIAESKDGRASVIEAISKSGTKYRLFFDTNTNLLLMMIVSWQNKEKSFEKKYFYSEYKEMDGLLIATKRVVEQDKKIIEETIIKSFKVNPTFKDNFFDVKK
jgi:hypothetical protein